MNDRYFKTIADKIFISAKQVENTIRLLEREDTIPFIARYRKKITDSFNEVQVTEVKEQLMKLREVDKHRESIINFINRQGKLTDKLKDTAV
ncbi:hypothetical protein J7K55_08520 [Candidatus Aerophobetes bacterium]|nr:hypothetical protein [Candidatus Aerophobetes bacterium]